MTRTVSLYAHDLDASAWVTLQDDILAAVAKARQAPGGSTVGGSFYDSHADEGSRSRTI